MIKEVKHSFLGKLMFSKLFSKFVRQNPTFSDEQTTVEMQDIKNCTKKCLFDELPIEIHGEITNFLDNPRDAFSYMMINHYIYSLFFHPRFNGCENIAFPIDLFNFTKKTWMKLGTRKRARFVSSIQCLRDSNLIDLDPYFEVYFANFFPNLKAFKTEREDFIFFDENDLRVSKGHSNLLSHFDLYFLLKLFSKQLKTLHINRTGKFNLKRIKDLRNLESLTVSNCNITQIEGLEKLQKLRTINFSVNYIESIDGLENLENLILLNLMENHIKSIKRLDNLKKLKTLNLHNNCISEIQGLSQLKILEQLCISCNKIEKIKGLLNLPNLKSLDLSMNIISVIGGLKELKNLETLDLDCNLIEKIEGLNNLQKLKKISLNSNSITKIEGFENLKNLYSLSIKQNPIKAKEIEQLHLMELDIENEKSPYYDYHENMFNQKLCNTEFRFASRSFLDWGYSEHQCI